MKGLAEGYSMIIFSETLTRTNFIKKPETNL